MTEALRRRLSLASVALAACLCSSAPLLPASRVVYAAQAVPSATPTTDVALSQEERATFLERAKVIRTRPISKGVTGTLRATLSDGTLTHDASIQAVDEYMSIFQSAKSSEVGFRDTWRYNVAAYQLSLLLGLEDMVPVTVERRHEGHDASFTWWVDDVLMDEGERLKKKLSSPTSETWRAELRVVRIFDQLIANVDRNLGNMLIDRGWHIWMIDHTRAFRRNEELKSEKALSRCDPALLKALKALTEERLKKDVGRWLRPEEIRPMLARRDRIVAFFEKQVPVG